MMNPAGHPLGASFKRFLASLVLLKDRDGLRYLDDAELGSGRGGRWLAKFRDLLRQLVSIELALPGTYYQEVTAYPVVDKKDLKAILKNERPSPPFPSERQSAILEIGERRSLVAHWYFPDSLISAPKSLLRLRIPASAALLFTAREGQRLFRLGPYFLLTECFPDAKRCLESRELSALDGGGLSLPEPEPLEPSDLLWRRAYGVGILRYLSASLPTHLVTFRAPALESRAALTRFAIRAGALAFLFFILVTPTVYFGRLAAEAGALDRAERARALRSEMAKVERYNTVVDDVTAFGAKTASLKKSFDLAFLLSRPPHQVEVIRYAGGATEVYGFTPSVSDLLATIEASELACSPELIRPVQRRGNLESFAVLCEGQLGL